MRSTQVNSFGFSGVSFVQYFLLIVKIFHGLSIFLPGVLVAYIGDDVNRLSWSVIFVFSCLSILVFQSFDVYSEAIFTNLYRFKNTLVSWSAAFVFD